MAGLTGSIGNYNIITSMMPQDTRVYYTRIQVPPDGYDQRVHGRFPPGGCFLVKLRLPSSWKSNRNPSNFHTVTLLFANHRDPTINPQMMGQGLEQLLDSHCDCRAGLRTAGSCLHRMAGMMLLCASACFDSAKQEEAVYMDTARPDSHIPIHSGPPCTYPQGNQGMLYQIRGRPQAMFPNSRIHTLGDLLLLVVGPFCPGSWL